MVIPTWKRRLTSNTSTTPPPTEAWLAAHDNRSSNIEEPETPPLESVLLYLRNNQDDAVSTQQIITTAKVFKTLADLCRNPETRYTLTETTELVEIACLTLSRICVDLAERASDDERAEQVFLLVQVLRCVCNLSADNDDARAKVLANGGIEALAKVLRSVEEVWRQPLPVGQAVFSAILNVSLDNSDCTGALIAAGVLQPHLKVFCTSESSAIVVDDACLTIWPLVSSSLDNLCEHEKAKAQFEGHSDYSRGILRSLAKLARLLSDSSTEENSNILRGAQRTLLWILCEILEKSETVRKQLCQPEYVLSLLDILEFYLISGTEYLDEDKGDDGEDDIDSGAKEAASQPPNRPMPQNTNRYAEAITQAIIGISGENEALDVLFTSQQLLARLLGILSTDRGSSQDARGQRLDAMAAVAALCLGNLARTDDHCTRLVAEHPSMIRTLIHEWFVSRSTNVRTRHAASGLLKNLCLPQANKSILVDFGLVKAAAASIDTAVVPIQANAIGILRHLANGVSAGETVLGLVERPAGKKACALEDLLQVVKGTDIDGIRCEGTRLIAAVAKKLYLKKPDSRITNNREMLTKAQGIVEQSLFDIVTPLVRLVMLDGQRHPLLQQESLVALTILASTDCQQSRHVGDIVRLLSPAESIPLAHVSISGDSQANLAGADEQDSEEQESSKGFGEILQKTIKMEGAVWPQTMLQAKSLISQLDAVVSAASNKSVEFNIEGLEVLHNELAPHAN
ncbi:Rap1 GTPase-GDP dissociation stimulator 1 [Coemansia spiralis]|uniref:Rap1 GTPase-GDP dissociation stimulator 1 n=2 Tax=Coemansia TaxID=4863 RepID=A0A9W8G3N2_9FUNG|nr:armadillo-type protein [Coemansia spiralis]KAJ1989768.1 Rap1 GTPase-GDP dissociation stimulator 1 [Coemansia umbellata]KAJ2621374.1 Rap1 GTPase-GDP dissociation stimulator 1 [Coemansia sp. RSA 1358]KAJ2673435.1 Rap1 GTPase-GDP dissociation stimulator 1 [Coemansia spiralis]